MTVLHTYISSNTTEWKALNLNPLRRVDTMYISCSDITIHIAHRCNYSNRMMLIITRQAMYVQCNIVALLRNIVAVKGNKYYIFWVWVCSIRDPACKAHAPYCRLWPVCLLIYFSTLSYKQRDIRKKVVEHKNCFGFHYIFSLKHFSF